MLRAGSLFYALAIAAIIALCCSSVLLTAWMNRLAAAHDTTTVELIRNAGSGIEVLLSDQSRNYNESETDLFGNGKDSVRLSKKSWGAFEIAIAEAHRGTGKYLLMAMTGYQSDHDDLTALRLADLNRPLSLCGKTEIRGDCFLPEAGVKRAYIEGESYAGEKLVYGQVKKAERFLPVYNDSLTGRISKLFHFVPSASDSVMTAEYFQATDSIRNSFFNSCLYYRSAESIRLHDKFISGQICFISEKSITVEHTAALENVLLIAPQIIIEEKVTGFFQAFARDSIAVEENVRLEYPSVLGLLADKESPMRAALTIGANTLLAGQVFACNSTVDFRRQLIVRIEEKAQVYGTVYSADLADLQGRVTGDLTCSHFELKTNSAVYENHLLHAVIDRPGRSPDFTASALVRQHHDHAEIVQWLK